MEIQVTSGSITEQSTDTYVVTFEERGSISGELAAVDGALSGAITRLHRDEVLVGKNGEVHALGRSGRVRAARTVIAGVGRGPQLTLDRLRNNIGTLARRLRDMNAGKVLISTEGLTSRLPAEDVGRTIAEGLVLGLYRFDKHHTKAADRPSGSVESVALVEPRTRRGAQLRRGVATGTILGEAGNLARDLENEPANHMTPTDVASHALELADDVGLECTVIERAEAERLGMGSYLSVAAGSVQPPTFIVLRYRGAGRARPLALIGKGITFDSGGISLKPGAGMEAMKADMSGAATVIGAMRAIGRLQPRVNVLAIAPCTENMPGGSATKPGDVVYAMDGQSIEVINTDAEGRLILADALAYANTLGLTPLIDVATLTGACSVALGDVATGVMTNDDSLAEEVIAAGKRGGEKLWQLPMYEEYEEQIKSNVADVKNTGGRMAGAQTAAKLLAMFVDDTPWAHLDMAGTDDASKTNGILVKGATGVPVRTLVNFVRTRAEA